MLKVGVIVLAVLTALIHFRLAFFFPTPDPLFLLNGLGYLGLLALLYLPLAPLVRFRPITRLVFIAYTLLTIILYFVIVGFGFNLLGYADKAIEAVLVVLLALEAAASRRRA